ncbi:hypothetical protein EGI22_21445 [Lacihabitans sp. LS3-19]|uniref:hypothetical protein n=1 Tax=Lacihabitans sp. LS3-19 TaxID=2487335 RepID=UPI0020CD58FA|nr:hypothetical protein [Lacihabitans sp. LS3-19]MCP9770481.1 hypothetical protein [Lacihabitans sp. LS3-19]
MKTVIINTNSSANARLILELAKKMGDTGKLFKVNELEDFLLGNIMEKVDKSQTVNTSTFLKKLRAKISE